MSDRAVDLEHFPESEAALRMLSYVTARWYEKSYVGKWTYEVMGQELDRMHQFFEELPYQFFIETATWGLRYHELKYGLDVREDLSVTARRARLIRKRDAQSSATPYWMEQFLQDALGVSAHIYDTNDGYDFGHVNRFGVLVEGDEYTIDDLVDALNTVKQSHTVFILYLILSVIILGEHFLPRLEIRIPMNWWSGDCFDGEYSFNGSVSFCQEKPPKLSFVSRILNEQEEMIQAVKLSMIWKAVIPEDFSESVIIRLPLLWNTGHIFDGESKFDGQTCFDQVSTLWPSVRIRGNNMHREEVTTNWRLAASAIFNEMGQDNRLRLRIPALWWDGVLFDGTYAMDGSIVFENIVAPEVKSIQYIVPMPVEESVIANMYIPALAAEYDGQFFMDGGIKFNSGREEL